MNFGEQIKKIRKDRNLTQQEMADQLNVSRQAISNWENDKNLPDIEMLITMARVFHLTLDELILGGTQMSNMTEKVIRDGSTNRRVRMNLIGIIIGSSLLLLSLLTLTFGSLTPPSMENYFGFAASALMFGGVATFLVIGIRHIIELFRNREQTEVKHGRLLATGGILMLSGILLFGFTLITGWISGLIGLSCLLAGIILIVVAAVKSK